MRRESVCSSCSYQKGQVVLDMPQEEGSGKLTTFNWKQRKQECERHNWKQRECQKQRHKWKQRKLHQRLEQDLSSSTERHEAFSDKMFGGEVEKPVLREIQSNVIQNKKEVTAKDGFSYSNN